MAGQRHYEEVLPISRELAELALRTDDEHARIDALLRLAYHDTDWTWVQDQCLRYLDDPNAGVRGMAALCLGHLARIHRRLDVDRVLPILHGLESDPQIGWRVQDALDDIEVFLGRR